MLVRVKGSCSIGWNPRNTDVFTNVLPAKNSSISGSYLRGGDCDYSKAREREKRTKYYSSVSLDLFVRVRVRVTTTPIARDLGSFSVNSGWG